MNNITTSINLINKHLPNIKSYWNGKIEIGEKGFNGYNQLTKTITLNKDSDISDIMHEFLHSCSVGEIISNNLKGHEELACELLMQKICEKENIKYSTTEDYEKLISALRNINSKINLYTDEYMFSKEYYLKDSCSGERCNWLNNLVISKLSKLNINDKIEVINLLNVINKFTY